MQLIWCIFHAWLIKSNLKEGNHWLPAVATSRIDKRLNSRFIDNKPCMKSFVYSDRQRNGVKSFVNPFVTTAGSQWKRIRLIKLWKCKLHFKQTELCYSWLIFPDWGVIIMKKQKMNFLEMWSFLRNSDTARQMTFWFPPFRLLLITHAWKYMHHYELHQMKEEDLSYTKLICVIY